MEKINILGNKVIKDIMFRLEQNETVKLCQYAEISDVVCTVLSDVNKSVKLNESENMVLVSAIESEQNESPLNCFFEKQSDYLIVSLFSMQINVLNKISRYNLGIDTVVNGGNGTEPIPKFIGDESQCDLGGVPDEEYYRIVDDLTAAISRQYSKDKIILIKQYNVNDYFVNGYVKTLDENWSEKFNKENEFLRKMDEYFCEKVKECHIIEFPENMFLDLNQPPEPATICPTEHYYKYLQEAVESILREKAIIDERDELERLKVSYSSLYQTLRDSINNFIRNKFLTINNFIDYIRALTKENYLIAISVSDTVGPMNEDACNALWGLGLSLLSEPQRSTDYQRKGYAAIINNGLVVFEKLAELNNSVEFSATIENIDLEIVSSPFKNSNRASIIVNGKEYAFNCRGFNIVVIDTANGSVLDSVVFDTWNNYDTTYRKIDYGKIAFCEKDSRYISNINSLRARLDPKRIIASLTENIAPDKCNKMKVRFFLWGSLSYWISIESLALCFAMDARFDVLVVSVNYGDFKAEKATVENAGLAYINGKNYNIEADKPDVVIVNAHFDSTPFNRFKKVKHFFQVPGMLINGTMFSDSFKGRYIGWEVFDPERFKCDAILAHKTLYDNLSQIEGGERFIFEFANPKFDFIVNQINGNNKKALPLIWRKTLGKKVILWAIDHGWMLKTSSFDLFYKSMISKINSCDNVCLIIRPHGAFSVEMLRDEIWTAEDFQNIKSVCKSSRSIIWDDSENYGRAYSLADAVITDVNCGIAVTALTLNKPLAVTDRYDNNKCTANFPEVYDNLYHIENVSDLNDFIDMIINGKDPKEKERQKLFDKYVGKADGKNGERIKDFIVDNYLVEDLK